MAIPKTLSEAGDVVVLFGNHKGKSMFEILDEDPTYIRWMINQEFVNWPTVREAVKIFAASSSVQEELKKFD